MIRHTALVCLLAGFAAGQEVNPMELLKLPVEPGAKRIAYGGDALQYGELRVPEGPGPHPVAVLVHGGCWVAKLEGLDERATALDLLRPMAETLARAGIATWNLEYRRMGHAGGGWPGTFTDVGQGADHLRKIAAENRLDLRRVAAVGHSAGGHLALWLAGRHGLEKGSALYVPSPLKVRGVVDLDGPGDLKAALPLAAEACGAPVITQLLGAPGEQAQRYREASPKEMLPLGVRQEVLAGAFLGALAGPYDRVAKAAGDEVKTQVFAEAGHFVFLDPRSGMWPKVLEAVRAALGDGR